MIDKQGVSAIMRKLEVPALLAVPLALLCLGYF